MEEANKECLGVGDYDDLEAVLGVDFVNAYGKFFRSAGVKGLIAKVPELAGMIFSECQQQIHCVLAEGWRMLGQTVDISRWIPRQASGHSFVLRGTQSCTGQATGTVARR